MSIGETVIYIGIFVALCVVLLMVQNLVRFLCILSSSNSGRNRVEGQFVEETIPYEYPPSSGNFVINSEVVMFQFEKDNEGGYLAVNKDCAICLGEFEEGEWLKLLPNCTHAFHVSCIDTWFKSHSNCPLCRSYVHHNTVTDYSDSLYTLLESSRSQDFSSTDIPPHFQSNQTPQNLEIITVHSCTLTLNSSPD